MVSKEAPKHSCKQRSSILSRKLLTVSNKAASLLFKEVVGKATSGEGGLRKRKARRVF